MMKELTERVSAPFISARNTCQSVYSRLDSRSKKAVMFAALLLFQLVIMTRTALTGVGSLAYAAFLPVLLLDGLAWAVRLLSGFRVSKVVYIPTVLLTFGLCTQAALSIFKLHPDVFLEKNTIDDIFYAILLCAVLIAIQKWIFRLIGKFLRILPWICFAATLVILALTAMLGNDYDAKLSIFGVQVHALIPVLCCVFMACVFSATGDSTESKVIFSMFYIAVCLAFYTLMSEYGTALILILSYVMVLGASLDLKNLGFIVKRRFRTKKSSIVSLIVIAVLLIGLVSAMSFVSDKINEKYEERVLPWIMNEAADEVEMTQRVQNAIEHRDAVHDAIAAGGLFGISDIHKLKPVVYVRYDFTFSMVAQLFGLVGGLLFTLLFMLFISASLLRLSSVRNSQVRLLGMFACFVLAAQVFCAVASSVGVLPLIGVTLAFCSNGMMSLIVTFVLLAIILSSLLEGCRAGDFEEAAEEERRSIDNLVADTKETARSFLGKAVAFFKSPSFIKGLLRTVAVICVFATVLLGACYMYISNLYSKVSVESLNRVTWQDEPVDDVKDCKLLSDKNVYNLLLLGVDYADNGRSDAIILLSVNKRKNTVTLLSFMRDNYLLLADGHGYHKLNSAYAYGGATLVMKTITNNFRIRIDDYAEINMEDFISLVDDLDFVNVKISKAEANYINGKLGTSFSAGEVKLNSREALTYSRARKLDSDRGRNRRQQKMIMAIVKRYIQLLKKGKLTQLDTALNHAALTVKTSMTSEQFMNIAPSLAIGFYRLMEANDEELEFTSVPVKKYFDNIIVKGNDAIDPHLIQNYEYIKETLY